MKNGVLVFPGWKENLYLKFLYQNQNNISFATYHGALFSLNRNFDSSKHKILHLHWVADLFAVTERNSVLLFLRFLISILDILWLKYIRQVRIVWTVHNLYAHECLHIRADKFARTFLGKIADKVIVHGARAIGLVENEFGVPPEKISVFEHGDFMAAFPNTISKREARELLNIPSGKKVFLFFGGANPYKGVENLVTAFNQFEDSDAILLIAGKGADLLKPFIRNNERIQLFDGFIPAEKMQWYMNAADWVVLPYNKILTSASLITAMGFRKAVIVPNIGTLPDYIDETGGIIYNTEQKDSLLSALQKSKHTNAETAGANNYEKVSALNWQSIIAKTQNLYSTILNER